MNGSQFERKTCKALSLWVTAGVKHILVRNLTENVRTEPQLYVEMLQAQEVFAARLHRFQLQNRLRPRKLRHLLRRDAEAGRQRGSKGWRRHVRRTKALPA